MYFQRKSYFRKTKWKLIYRREKAKRGGKKNIIGLSSQKKSYRSFSKKSWNFLRKMKFLFKALQIEESIMYTEEFVFNTCKFFHHQPLKIWEAVFRWIDPYVFFKQGRPLHMFVGIQNCTWFQRKDLVNKQQWPEICFCSIRVVACFSFHTV